jgi:aryl-alcohol dehydrogenase-like predicted oxidoreductase
VSVACRTLGRTGIAVSEVGFGCGTTAELMIRGTPQVRREAVARALAFGINYFDTAPVYGDTLSERNLGRALREVGGEPIVATKVSIGPDQLSEIADFVVRSAEASIERLGLRRLSLIQLHNRVGEGRANRGELGSGALLTVDDVLGRGGVVEGFRALRSRGLVGFFGCSAFGGSMRAVTEVVDSGAFDAIIVNYSALNATAWQKLPAAAEIRDYSGIGKRAARNGLGVIALRVLEGGALTGVVPGANAKLTSDHAELMRRAHCLEATLPLDEPLAQTAIRFALSNPDVATVLVGFSNIEQIDEACASAAKGALESATLAQIEALRATDFCQAQAASDGR